MESTNSHNEVRTNNINPTITRTSANPILISIPAAFSSFRV